MLRLMRNRYLLSGDAILAAIAYIVSVLLIFPVSSFPQRFLEGLLYAALSAVVFCAFRFYFGVYRVLWRSVNAKEAGIFLLAHAGGTLFSFALSFLFLGGEGWLKAALLYCALQSVFTLTYRLFVIFLDRHGREAEAKNGRRTLIIGAGSLGMMLVRDIGENKRLNYFVVGFLDDDEKKAGKLLYGKEVLGPVSSVARVVREKGIEEIIFAIYQIDGKRKAEILNLCSQTGVRVKILPGVEETLSGGTASYSGNVRDIRIEDLLERDPISLDNAPISEDLKGKVVMVTGGGGSIGSELCRQILRYRPEHLLILDIYENTTYILEQELRETYPDQKLDVLIASVRDKKRLFEIFETYRPSYVFHAAAHKHVPLMEESPAEAIKNNVFGTYYVALCAEQYGAKRFVMISTDKAVNPTNVMGATKRLCEMVVQAFAKSGRTQFVAVRFGNVLGSNGSVVPFFQKQIKKGGPVTVTHPEITRFFMTIPEAAQLVLQAASYAKGGEIFVLDMGKPVKIRDLAERMIRLSGYEPGVDIEIKYTGLRPGEKLYEELLMDEEGLQKTHHAKIFIGKLIDITMDELEQKLSRLSAVLSGDNDTVKAAIAETVPTYRISE